MVTWAIDLNDGDGHQWNAKFVNSIDSGNRDITFSNYPASGTSRDWRVVIEQDAIGGIGANWPAEVVNPPTIGTAANTVSMVVFTTYDGGTTVYAAVQVNAAPGTTTGLANVALDNLVSPAINTSLISDTDNTDDLGSASKEWRDLYIDGTANIDTLSATTLGGNMNVNDKDFTSVRNLRFGTSGQLLPTESNIYTDASGDMLFNVATGDQFFLTIADTSIVGLAEGDTQFINNNGVSTLDLINRDSTPIDLDQVGELRFRADDDAGGESIQTYGRILVNMDDVTTTSVDGRMTIQVAENNTLTDYLVLNSFSSPGVLQIKKTTDFASNFIDIDNLATPSDPAAGTRRLFVDSGTGELSVRTSSTTTVSLEASATAGATTALDNLVSPAINTSLISDTDDTDDLGSASIKWRDVFVNRNLRFGVTGQLHPTEPNIYADASGDMLFNVATADQFFFTENDVSIVGLSEGDTQFINNNGVSTLDLINRDSTPIDLDQVGELRFRADDDAGGEAIATYGRILVNMDDVTSTSKDGRMTIQVVEDNTLTDYIVMNSLGQGEIEFKEEVEFEKDVEFIGDLLSNDGTQNIGTSSTGFNNIYSDNTLFCSNLKVWSSDSDINLFNDLDVQAGSTIDYADTASTAGTSSQTLPANPDGFIIIKVNGASKRIPYYVP